MQSLPSWWRAHGNHGPASGTRASGSRPAARSRWGWRSFLVAGLTGLLALAATPTYAATPRSAQAAWLPLPSMPIARTDLTGTTAPCPGPLGDYACVYAIGGSSTGTVEAYIPAANIWATLPPAPTARSDLAAATAPCPHHASELGRTCVYAIGGSNGSKELDTAEAYSPAANIWATLPAMPTARTGPAAATAPCPQHISDLGRTCVYVIGGSSNRKDLDTVQAYSPASNTWATLPSVPTARSVLAAATAPCPPGIRGLEGTCVYAIGGFTRYGFKDTTEAYSPATNTWATLPSMPTARTSLAGTSAPCPNGLTGTCVYAIGGYNDGKDLSTVEAYIPALNIWATLPSLPAARRDLAAATAPCPGTVDGACVYAIGGQAGDAILGTASALAVGG